MAPHQFFQGGLSTLPTALRSNDGISLAFPHHLFFSIFLYTSLTTVHLMGAYCCLWLPLFLFFWITQ